MAAIFHYLLPFHCFVNMKVVKNFFSYNNSIHFCKLTKNILQNKIEIKRKTGQ